MVSSLRHTHGLSAMHFLAVLAVALIAGCSGESRPFSKTSAPAGRTAPAISIVSMTGIPSAKSAMLVNFVQQAAAKRDIAVVPQDFSDSWKLSGQFNPQSGQDGNAALAFSWLLQDGKGRTIHQISGTEPIGLVGAEPWAAVSPDSLRGVAVYTAENIASRLGQLGFATQTNGLVPPSDTYARAGPNAEKELDYETLYGNRSSQINSAPKLATAEPQPDSPVEPNTDQSSVNSSPAQETSEPAKSSKAKPGAKAIRGVTVTGVTGSPGKGNSELADAMRRTLKKSGWPVYDKPRPDALNIAGNVKLGKKSGANQKVALAWTVSSPDGKNLGTIRQENNVPAGSLDSGWGQTAEYAAQAGAQGIFDLVGKLR